MNSKPKLIKIKSGDVFAYLNMTKSNYGLIQVVSKGDTGYNVRVFYFVSNDLSDSNILKIINSKEYYYIQNFYENELLIKSDKYLGNYIIPDFIEIPNIMRISERKPNGKLVWYIIEVKTGKIIKTFNNFNEELVPLSPARIWGIDYIKRRWEEKFTLELWNDQMEDFWYNEYLRQYEPEKLKKNQDSNILSIQNNKPTINWRVKITNNISMPHLTLDTIKKIDDILDEFIYSFSNNSNKNIVLKKLITDLNTINKKYHCIETVESEELLEYIGSILRVNDSIDMISEVDNLRNW